MEGVGRDENRVRLLVTWHNRVSTTPVVVPLQGLVVCVCGSAAVDIVLQVIRLVDGVGCGVD